MEDRAAIGVVGEFDGFHAGHRALLRKATSIAARSSRPLVAAVLEREGESELMPSARRCELLLRNGAALAVVLRGPVGADEDIAQELIDTLRLSDAVLAERPSLAHRPRWPRLRTSLTAAGVELFEVPRVRDRLDRPITASLIAGHLVTGRVDEIVSLLGRPYAVSGVVDLGDQRSHRLGFPTANVTLDAGHVWPARGVYAGWARVDGVDHAAAINVGTRPTIHGSEGVMVLEAHLLDFGAPIYGKSIDVSLVRLLRPERRFTDVDELARQIATDVDATRRALG